MMGAAKRPTAERFGNDTSCTPGLSVSDTHASSAAASSASATSSTCSFVSFSKMAVSQWPTSAMA